MSSAPRALGKENSMPIIGLAFLLLLLAVPAAAGPLDHPGYTKAFSCSACHGFAGNSRSATMPILAGMNATYVKKALQDYASGKRPSPEMEPYAKMGVQLGADDVASYFASQTKIPTPIAADAAVAGLLGVGGAIVMIPLLLYVPPLLGVGALDMRSVTGVTIVQVFVAALSGMIAHRRGRAVHLRLAWIGGTAMAIGMLSGALVSALVPDVVELAVFALMATAAAVLMFLPLETVGIPLF